MEVRYFGFEQRQNARTYRFDVLEKGHPTRSFVVTADVTLFHAIGVGIQEGPGLSATKLLADLERDVAGEHQLTDQDLRAYVSARSAAVAKRAEMRKTPRRPPRRRTDFPGQSFGQR